MREVCWSRIALVTLACCSAYGCGSSENLTGDAPSSTSEMVNVGSKDGGAKLASHGDAGGSSNVVRADAGKASSGADAALSTSDPDNCGKSGFSTGSIIPDMLIVLDRSGSMKPTSRIPDGLRCDNIGPLDFLTGAQCDANNIDCTRPADKLTVYCGGTQQKGSVNRWDPSVSALEKLTAQFDTTVSFGLMTFPSTQSDSCGPGDVQVPIGLGTAAPIKKVLDSTKPGGGTPTGETLQAALKLFQDSAIIGDTVAPTRYVLLVTDGQPTCPNAGGGNNARQNQLDADVKFTTDALDALNAEGIKTFVVGYDADLDPTFSQALTSFAVHGGTDMYFPVQNEDSLTNAFKSISQKVVTCAFEFKTQVKDPRLVHVTLDGNTLRPDDPNGWTLVDKTVTVQGDSCAALQTGKGHRIEIVMECEPVMYL